VSRATGVIDPEVVVRLRVRARANSARLEPSLGMNAPRRCAPIDREAKHQAPPGVRRLDSTFPPPHMHMERSRMGQPRLSVHVQAPEK
jgi:hypothetical protein